MLILLLLIAAFVMAIGSLYPPAPGWLLSAAVILVIVILAIGSAGSMGTLSVR